MLNRSIKFLIIISIFLIGICFYLLNSTPTFLEKINLRTNNKIVFAGSYGVTDTYNIILKKQNIGEIVPKEKVEELAIEFNQKYGGQIIYINQFGPNFGIKNISSDIAYQISADERVLQVQQELNENAPPQFY